MKKQLHILIAFLITALNLSAQIVFEKRYGMGTNMECYSARQTNDGGYIITGRIFTGGGSIVLIKTNSYGDTLWTRNFAALATSMGWTVEQTTDGGYIVAGPCLLKLDANGNISWSKYYNSAGAYTVQQTSDGGYICGGWDNTKSLIKTDGFGNPIWQQYYPEIFDLNCVQQTSDGGYIITGVTNTYGAGSGDVCLVKTDNAGNRMWSKTYGGTAWDIAYSLQQTTDGGYILAGYTSSFGTGSDDVYVIKTDSIGTMTWSKTFGGALTDDGYSVQQTNDGGYVISGPSLSWGTGYRMYVIKIDAAGSLLWSKAYGTAGATFASTVRQTTDNGYMVAGTIASQDYFLLAKTDSTGHTGCEINTATITTTPATLEINYTDTVYALTPVATSAALTLTSGLTVSSNCVNAGNDLIHEESFFSITPNPFNDELTVSLTPPLQRRGGWVGLYDVYGKEILSQILLSPNTKLNTHNFKQGIYFVKITTDTGYVVKKFVKE